MELTNDEKAKEIAEFSKYLSDFPHHEPSVRYGAIEMAKWKDEQMRMCLENMLDSAIESCNCYIEKHPENKLMLKYHLGQVGLLDKLLKTDSRGRIHMAFATMD